MSASTSSILSTLTLVTALGSALYLRHRHHMDWPEAILVGVLIAGSVFTVAGV
jgi:drug/metabolite transporter (DMT)-like permease